jgi:hypothetical protein
VKTSRSHINIFVQFFTLVFVWQFSNDADDVNLLGGNIDTVKKNTEALIDASKKVGVEANTEKTMYMLLSRHQNAGQNHDIKIANRTFENVAQFRYLRTKVTNQNLSEEEIKEEIEFG